MGELLTPLRGFFAGIAKTYVLRRGLSSFAAMRLVVREGCIGETGAALEAREAALTARQPALASRNHSRRKMRPDRRRWSCRK